MIIRRALIFAALSAPQPANAQRMAAVAADSPAGAALVARLRAGGLVLFFRHADTGGEPCDRSFVVGDRAGQRNISPAGRAQSVAIGARLAALGIPIAEPVLAGPVFRARDTAEAAFGAARVVVTDSLLADDYAGPRLAWVLAEHRRLFSEPPPQGRNRILVGHRTPAIQVVGDAVAGQALPEGAALVLVPDGRGISAPGGASSSAPGATPGGGGVLSPQRPRFTLLGILEFAPAPSGGFHGCG